MANGEHCVGLGGGEGGGEDFLGVSGNWMSACSCFYSFVRFITSRHNL